MAGLANIIQKQREETRAANRTRLLGNSVKQLYYIYVKWYGTHPIDLDDMIDGLIAAKL